MKLFHNTMLKLAIIFYIFVLIQADSVCDEKTLLMELKQDIEDNGVLDCLRVIQPPHNYLESIEERNKRIAAQWDSQCAFEAEYDWMRQLREIHGINNLVDDTGDIVERDFDDQADMCEIIRAALAAGKFSKVTTDLVNIPLKVLDLIDCVGEPEQTEICAVTGSSYFQSDTWNILLEGLAITADSQPTFIQKGEEGQSQDIPEVSTQEVNRLKEKEKQRLMKKKKAEASIKKVAPEDQTKLIMKDIDGIAKLDSSNKWKGVPDMTADINENDEKIMLVSATFYDKVVSASHTLIKFILNGNIQTDSKSINGNQISQGLQSAFISKLRKGVNQVFVEYRSPSQLQNANKNGQSETSGRSLGILLFNKNTNYWKKAAEKQIKFISTDKMIDAEMKLSFTTEKPSLVLLFYSMSFNAATVKFTTQLKLNDDVLKQSLSTGIFKPYVNHFGAAVVKVNKGDQQLNLQYISNKPATVQSNDWQSFGLSALQLPESAKFTQKQIIVRETLKQGNWNKIESLKIKVELTASKNILIYYQLSALTNGKEFQTRVSVNSKALQQTYCNGNEERYSTGKIMTFTKLEKGNHVFNLEYKIAGSSSSDPLDVSQGASLMIVELDI